MRRRSKTGGLEAIRTLIEEAVASVSSAAWTKRCEHVVQIEKQYWEHEHVAEEIERVVVPLASSDSEEDEEEEEDAE